ncbi:MAG: hypothetical protein QOJ40_2896 [Verrucomicrobiota bacterium]
MDFTERKETKQDIRQAKQGRGNLTQRRQEREGAKRGSLTTETQRHRAEEHEAEDKG